jgi:60 kDa SS-A/Ro ribonucleoprotein
MKVNVATPSFTYEGGKAFEINPFKQLRRTILSCMLFEDNFYENGIKCVDRIKALCAQCTCLEVLFLANESHFKYHLRHIPLLLIIEALKLEKRPPKVAMVIYSIINRPDQMTDLLALYWKDGKKPLAHPLKRGLALAFTKFDEYQLAKYNRDDPIKLRDVLFLCHAKPANDTQAELWKRLINKELKIPDTWETRLSAGQDKKQTFVELLQNGKMGKLAILRNLRNMLDSGVDKQLVASELQRNMKEMLPFQYLAAARECPQWEDIIDSSMIASCALKPMLQGKTVILIDVSGSMDAPLSTKSKMTRMDSACGLAILLRECVNEGIFLTFSEGLAVIPGRQGMALRDAIVNSQPHGSTHLGLALNIIKEKITDFDRLIVITDEQTSDNIPEMKKGKNYILNVGTYENGVGNTNQWTTISGFSEASIDYIREYEEIG